MHDPADVESTIGRWLTQLRDGTEAGRQLARTELGLILEARGLLDEAIEAYARNVEVGVADRRPYERLAALASPLSATSSFTAYAARDFGASDQERLAAVLRALGTRKVAALLSNSDCGTTRELFRGFDRIDSVSARRAINSRASARGPVTEFLLTNLNPRNP